MRVALIFLLLGVLSGSILGFAKFIISIFKNHIIAQIIGDLIFSLTTGAIFVFATNYYFFGEIRLYIFAIFMFGMFLERKTLGKLFAKVYLLLYNGGRKTFLFLKSTRFGKIFFK